MCLLPCNKQHSHMSAWSQAKVASQDSAVQASRDTFAAHSGTLKANPQHAALQPQQPPTPLARTG